MKFVQTAAAIAALATVPLFAADADLLRMVGSGAKAVGGVYVDKTLTSQLGRAALSRLGEGEAGFRKFIETTGLDPRRDLREIVLASEGDKEQGLILVRGTFNQSQLAAAAVAAGGQKIDYNGVELIGPQSAKQSWFAVLDGTILLAGNEDLVKAALDRRAEGGQLDPQLAAKINDVSNLYDVWFASSGDTAFAIGKSRMPPEAARAVETVSGGIRFGTDVEFAGEAVMRTEKDATSFLELFRFLVGMAQMQQRHNPDLARVAALLAKSELTSAGNVIRFRTTVPSLDIETWMQAPRRTARVR